MIETRNYINAAERRAWLTRARAWGAAFPQFADLVARIEAQRRWPSPFLHGTKDDTHSRRDIAAASQDARLYRAGAAAVNVRGNFGVC